MNIGTTTGGGFLIGSGTTWNYTGQINIISSSTHTVTTSGKTLNQLTINGAIVSLGGSLIVTNALTITSGTFSTTAANYTVTCSSLSSSNANTRTINLNASTVNITNNSGANGLDFTNQTNLTFTAGTSTIVFTGNTLFVGNTRSFYNVKLSGASAQVSTVGAFAITNNFILDANPSLTIGSAFTYANLDTSTSTGSQLIVIGLTYSLFSYGQNMGIVEVYAPSGTVTLQDNFTGTQIICLGGTVSTNNKTINATSLQITSIDASTRTLSLGSSVITISALIVEQINGGTSTIVPSTSQITINGDGGFLESDGTTLNLNRLTLSATTNVSGGVQITSSSGGSLPVTVADYMALTGYVTMDSVDGLTSITLTGALHLGGTPNLNISSNDGAQVAFNVSGTITPSTASLADINATGSTTPWNFFSSGAMMTDTGNNSGITFPAPGNIGTATGTSTVSGVGRALFSSVGTSAGISVVSGSARALVNSVGTAIGSSTVLGTTSNFSLATGTASGTSTVSGVAQARINSVGTSVGIATVSGVSPILMLATGTAIGSCIVQAQGNLISTQPSSTPTEFAENISTSTEFGLSINTAPSEYSEDIENPTEYVS